MQHREPSLVLSEDLEGGVGERVGAEGGLRWIYTHTITTDSSCCTAETITAL